MRLAKDLVTDAATFRGCVERKMCLPMMTTFASLARRFGYRYNGYYGPHLPSCRERPLPYPGDVVQDEPFVHTKQYLHHHLELNVARDIHPEVVRITAKDARQHACETASETANGALYIQKLIHCN